MPRPDFLSHLPSLDELLAHPRVAPVVERLNQSAAAGQVRSALASLGAEVTRRAEAWQSLGAADLVERLVRQLELPRRLPASRVVNATGRFFEIAAGRRPLAAAAAEAARLAAEGTPIRGPERSTDAARHLWGIEAAWVAPSLTRALATSLEALFAGGALVVARGDMRELAAGLRLDDLCRRCGVRLVEVGAIDAVRPDEYRYALEQLPHGPRGALLRGPLDVATLTARAAAVREAGGRAVVLAGDARPRLDTPAYADRSASIEDALRAHADLALADGAGWIGGPVSGLAVGVASAVSAIAKSPGAQLDTVDPLLDESLEAALDLFSRPDELRFTHPLHQLLDAPLENLRLRAIRLADRLAALEEVESATPTERANALRGASWGIRVRPTGGDLPPLLDRLRSADPAVLGDNEADCVLLDLATVSPSQDRLLVTACGVEPVPNNPSKEGNTVAADS